MFGVIEIGKEVLVNNILIVFFVFFDGFILVELEYFGEDVNGGCVVV